MSFPTPLPSSRKYLCFFFKINTKQCHSLFVVNLYEKKTTNYRTGFSLIPVHVICLHMQCDLTSYAFGYRIQRDGFLLLICLLQGILGFTFIGTEKVRIISQPRAQAKQHGKIITNVLKDVHNNQ